MFEFLLLLVLLLTAPLLAIVVLVNRLRDVVRRGGAGTLAAGARAAWRDGTRRPVWPALIAAVAAAALLTAGLEALYLATVTNGPDWGFDVVLLSIMVAALTVLVCVAFVGAATAAVSRVRGFGAGVMAGLLALVAVAVGTAGAYLPLLAVYRADPGRFPVVANLGEGDLLVPFNVLLAGLIWALPWPVLAAALASRAAARREPPHDVWQVLLDLATADLPANRSAWGTALRAELAAIDPPAARRRFALGGVRAALRSGLPVGAWLQAIGVAAVVAGGTLAASRWSLAHGRGGILGYWVFVPAAVLLAVALVAAWRNRSFGAGMRTGALAGLAAMAGVLAVSIPEAAVWADLHAGYLSTGDAVPPTRQAAVLDVLRPEFLLAMIFTWTQSAALGAALGLALGSRRTASPADVGPLSRSE